MPRVRSALALVALLLPLGTTYAASAPARSTPLAVTGFILTGSPNTLVDRDAHALTTLGVDGVSLAADGASVADPGAGALRLLTRAHDQGLRAELLLSNYSNRLGDFDSRAAARLLRDPDNVEAVVHQLAGFVADQGWDGIAVDLESLSAADSDGLVDLITGLQGAMPTAKAVSIDMMASAARSEYADRGYDLDAIVNAVDTVTIMTYDLHGPGWSGPGSIGGLGWQRQVLDTLLQAVPAAKVDLGVSGYGYTWPRHGTGRSVTVAQARALVSRDHAKARWDARQGEWTATLHNGTVLWWSDGRSYDLRVKLAQQRGLHGLSLWRLGSADPL